MMKFTSVAIAVLGVGLIGAGPASAQEWMISPTPAVPLHTMAMTPPAPSQPSPPPAWSAPLPPAAIVPHTRDEIRRLLDPYGLNQEPTSAATVPDPVRILPSVPLNRPTAMPQNLLEPPVVAFPQFPVTWLFGF